MVGEEVVGGTGVHLGNNSMGVPAMRIIAGPGTGVDSMELP